jgi:hypothetical protein
LATLSYTIEGDRSPVHTVNPIVAKMMHCKTAAASYKYGSFGFIVSEK